MTSAIEMARMEAQGPSTTAAIPTPTACPVVPPGSGRLNIMMTKEKAANSESSGTSRVCSRLFTRRIAVYQKGADPAYIAAQVAGLRYPSGMCIDYPYSNPYDPEFRMHGVRYANPYDLEVRMQPC